ncbi:hypothetical protein NUW58_g1704 [Xylaria curta]|uniref:Uncharacterized protein n=1 Tax=Xylaria curta TaxID=42375 RepID=A0ACC1PLI9_9PEZI|nr:hypothetical protein NUW58_g1704 [Xylaria curta]
MLFFDVLSSTLCLTISRVKRGSGQDIATDDAAFYGQSPPVYPSPQGIGIGDWANAYSQAKAAVSQLSREEKVNLTGGVSVNNACSGFISPVPRANFTGLCLSDAGNGLRTTNFVSSWPAGLSVGARLALHFIANEQETNRNPEGGIAAVSSNIDDKTMHELYLWPFQDAVKAGTGNIMCSYNRINNSYGCANSKTQNGLLKRSSGFRRGFIVTDWGAQHAGVATALAGLDMVMPNGSPFWASNLTMAVNNGSVPESRLDDMATRMKQEEGFPPPGIGMPDDLAAPHQRVIAKSPSNKDVLLQGAVEGHVLLKNEKRAPCPSNPPNSSPSASVHMQIAPNGTLISGGGSGANQPAYLSSPFEALSLRAYDDGTSLWWDFHSGNPKVDQSSDACIVVGNAFASEGWDRLGLHDDFTDALIKDVASQCNKTIVVFHNAGVRLVDQFIDHPNVTALIFAHLPGQDAGRALVSILYGDVNPSGKLPYSVPRNESDFGPLQNATQPDGIYALFPQSGFNEGVYIDYRAFDAKNITPRYEFGFGLSYTTFNYSNLAVWLGAGADFSPYPSKPIIEGGHEDLWDNLVRVSATVTNMGSATGAEVAQLYVGIPNGPIRQLRGFAKPVLQAGESAVVNFGLTRRDLSTWDAVAQNWLLQKGTYQVYVGSSSRKLPLAATLQI